MTDAEWDDYAARWDVLVDGIADRVSPEELADIRHEGIVDPCWGIGGVLGGHEIGLWELTPAEEDETWELAALHECSVDFMLNDGIRSKSVRNRPLRTVRPKHPLRGGGHGPGRGRPGKREFPATWSDDDTMAHTMDVARRPSGAIRLPTDDFRAYGERSGVELGVVVSPAGEVRTSYPVSGSGVVQNPLDEWQTPAVERLRHLLDEMVPADGEPRDSLVELLEVGEWPHVLGSLRALDLEPSDEQRRELGELSYLAALPPD